MNQFLTYLFIVSIVLVLAVYYVGVTNDLTTFKDAAVAVIQVGTGRDAQGQFANYPGGASPADSSGQPFKGATLPISIVPLTA